MNASLFEMNPELDLDRLRAAYRVSQRLHIPSFLTPSSAQRLHQYLTEEVTWSVFLRAEGHKWEIPPSIQETWDAVQRQELLDAAFSSAAKAYTSFYDCKRGIPTGAAARAQEGSLLARFVDTLNCEPFVKFFRELTGLSDIAYANAQATRYTPGHFITPHSDAEELVRRRAAYVFNLTPQWKTEWGGLLQFIGADGHIAEAYAPRFNALNVFTVPKMHAVSLVSPFAGAARYSITGWLWAS